MVDEGKEEGGKHNGAEEGKTENHETEKKEKKVMKDVIGKRTERKKPIRAGRPEPGIGQGKERGIG